MPSLLSLRAARRNNPCRSLPVIAMRKRTGASALSDCHPSRGTNRLIRETRSVEAIHAGPSPVVASRRREQSSAYIAGDGCRGLRNLAMTEGRCQACCHLRYASGASALSDCHPFRGTNRLIREAGVPKQSTPVPPRHCEPQAKQSSAYIAGEWLPRFLTEPRNDRGTMPSLLSLRAASTCASALSDCHPFRGQTGLIRRHEVPKQSRQSLPVIAEARSAEAILL